MFTVLIPLVSIPVTNTSVNPPGSIGPALLVVDWALAQRWLFIVAPLIGAVLGSLVHRFLFTGSAPVEAEQSAVAGETPGDATSRAAARRSAGRTRT